MFAQSVTKLSADVLSNDLLLKLVNHCTESVCGSVQQGDIQHQNKTLGAIMIDVRTEWEYNDGHITNAKGPLLIEHETNWEPSVLSWGADK